MDNPTVFVVEDDDIARSFVSDILEHEGYRVQSATNGREALERIREGAPDLILSDVMMPEMNGFDLFRKVQEDAALQDVPFVFLTSLDDGDALIRIQELGPDEYIAKPVRPRHLLATVKGKLVRKQRRDEKAERERGRLRDSIRWTLTHELRTPLTVIQGISELLLNESQLPQETDVPEMLQSLRAQSFRLGQLIENFLLVNRIESGVEEENQRRGAGLVSLEEAIEEAAIPFGEKARAMGARFAIDVGPSLPPVRAFRPHLLEVFRQIIDNAFKFADPERPAIEVRAAADGDRLKVTVTDNGKGLSLAERDLLFRKLSQIHREVNEQQGSGLGLFIAKRLVDMNGGSIEMTGEPGQCARVEITFPAGGATETAAV